MLYHLLYPLHNSVGVFNVFRYITVRSIGSAVTAFLIMLILGPWFIRKLKQYQIGQVVREDGRKHILPNRVYPPWGAC